MSITGVWCSDKGRNFRDAEAAQAYYKECLKSTNKVWLYKIRNVVLNGNGHPVERADSYLVSHPYGVRG